MTSTTTTILLHLYSYAEKEGIKITIGEFEIRFKNLCQVRSNIGKKISVNLPEKVENRLVVFASRSVDFVKILAILAP